MLAAGCNPEDAILYINELGLGSTIALACINSPESVTFSGDSTSIAQLLAYLQGKKLFARTLKTGDVAYHSHHMSALGQEYQDYLTAALPSPEDNTTSVCTWISSLTGKIFSSSISHDYWRDNLQSPVLFSAAILQLYKRSNYHIMEIGPHSVLELPIKQTISKSNTDEDYFHYLSALHRNKSSLFTMLSLVGQLFLYGHSVDLESVNNIELDNADQQQHEKAVTKGPRKQLIDLPNYPWLYTSVLWNEPRLSKEFRDRRYSYHALLGSQNPGGSGKIIQWRNMLKARDVPWLEGHKLDQSIVFPCAGYITMALEAICQATHTTKKELLSFELANINILKALVLQDPDTDTGIEIFTTLQLQQISSVRKSNRWWVFEISSFEAGTVVNHANGLIRIEHHDRMFDRCLDVAQAIMEHSAPRNWYDRLTKIGLNFSGSFKSLFEISIARDRKRTQAIAKTKYLPGPDRSQSDFIIHPVTIDALLQAGFIASSAGVIQNLSAKVPVAIENANICIPSLSARSELLTIQASSESVGPGVINYTTEMYDSRGQIIVQLKSCREIPYQNGPLQGDYKERHPMLRVIWKPDITKVRIGQAEALNKYLDSVASSLDCGYCDGMERVLACLDLLTHKDSSMRILELRNNENSPASKVLYELLQPEDTFKRCHTLTQAHMIQCCDPVSNHGSGSADLQRKQMLKEVKDAACDLVIFSEVRLRALLHDYNTTADCSFSQAVETSRDLIDEILDHVLRVLVPGGLLLLRLPMCATPDVEMHGFKVLYSAPDDSKVVTTLARSLKEASNASGKTESNASGDIILVSSVMTHFDFFYNVACRWKAMKSTR